MDFKTVKIKIKYMKRKFNHEDLAMVAGAATMIGLIAFMIITQGVTLT